MPSQLESVQTHQSLGDLDADLPQPLPDEENQMTPAAGIDVYFTQPTPHAK